jgi:uronate dehydrogenase
MKTILMTGAAGGIGTFLRQEFKGKYKLRLSDREPINDLSGDETFMPADLTDFDAVKRAADGVDGILHFGGCAGESDWQTILDANIIGMRNIYEAASQTGVKRVMWASSNHAVGFYRRDQTIDHTVYPKPDSRYGVSKVFGDKAQDQSEPYADAVLAKEPPASPDDPDEIHQGGAFVSTESGGGRPRSETV